MQFVKSSYSIANCVEIAVTPLVFVKGSSSNLECLEAGAATDGHCIVVRDSKDPNGLQLHLDSHLWTTFIRDVSDGQYDYDQLGLMSPVSACCEEHGHLRIVRDLNGNVRLTHNLKRGAKLVYTQPEWEAFVAGARNGEFDLVSIDGAYRLRGRTQTVAV